MQYQLASDYTSFVVVAELAEGEKADGLPATIAVKHMLAAGWGGTSRFGFRVAQYLPAPPADTQAPVGMMLHNDLRLSRASLET